MQLFEGSSFEILKAVDFECNLYIHTRKQLRLWLLTQLSNFTWMRSFSTDELLYP
jgi:hypothetical protein